MVNLMYTLRSGRRIGVTAFGDAGAERVIVFCHVAPGSSAFDPDPGASTARDVHIVAIDRPGYGSSDPLQEGEWPSIARAADDIAEYLRSIVLAERPLGVGRTRAVGIAGWSAGGRIALAFAARHPDLTERVAVVATPAPNDAVSWIPPQLQAESDRLSDLPAPEAIRQLSAQLQPQADAVLGADQPGDVPLEAVGGSAADDAVLADPGVRDRLGRMLQDAFCQGTAGVAADILSYTARPWGFALADVRATTLIVGGRDDALIGNAHAAWYQKAISDARTEMVPGAGHLVIVPAWGRVLAHLAPGSTHR